MRAQLRIRPENAPPATVPVRLDALGFVLEDGGVRGLSWHGIELLRGLTYPVRDADWGTVATAGAVEDLKIEQASARYVRDFDAAGGGFSGRFTLEADASGHVTAEIRLTASTPQTVSRAGFTLLHPIVALSGRDLTIIHADGSEERTTFPSLISPSQPAFDIVGLRYEIDGCAIDIAMSGDIFEMEDQRNWSDASYKTYCRPLALPHPFVVAPGESIVQRIEIVLGGTPRASVPAVASPTPAAAAGGTLPAVALAIEAGWHHDFAGALDGIPSLVRIDLRKAGASLAPLPGPFDLELITSDDAGEAATQIKALSAESASQKLTPGHVIALPAAFLKSYQPTARWPTGAQPAEVAAAARAAFPDARIGAGVLTNFTELNRRRPDPALDYITHGSSATVHAADDTSIFQTIEALPQIFASAVAMAPGRPYRLGLVSIGMRTNPYGAGLSPNPEGVRKTMTDDDPRARTRIGAAWMVAAMGATSGFGIELIALAAPAGPFGLVEPDGRFRPAFHVVRRLHEMAGRSRSAFDPGSPALHAVAVENGDGRSAIVANCSPSPASLTLPQGTRGAVLDGASEAAAAADSDWARHADRPLPGVLDLAPYAIAFLAIPQEGPRP